MQERDAAEFSSQRVLGTVGCGGDGVWWVSLGVLRANDLFKVITLEELSNLLVTASWLAGSWGAGHHVKAHRSVVGSGDSIPLLLVGNRDICEPLLHSATEPRAR